jgi:NitT/TauT family transport system permease protein
MKTKKNKNIYQYIIFIIILIFIWGIISQNADLRLFISSPRLTFLFLTNNLGFILNATVVTFYESFAGLIVAILFAFLSLIICFYIPKLFDFLLPIMVTSQVIPLITLAPLFILLFGIGIPAKIMMAGLLCFFPVFINFALGVKLIPKDILHLMTIYKATKTQKIFKVYFPLALPHIMTGIKIAATLGVMGAIVSEFNGAEIGLGKNLFLAAKRLEPELMMCSLFFSSLLGGLMYIIIAGIEKLIGKWYIK